MHIVRSLADYSSDEQLLLTIGVFDGVHIGHRAVLARLTSQRKAGLIAGALTFEGHPQEFLEPGAAPKYITTVDEKVNLLDACGLDVLFLLPFDERIQSLSAEKFLRDVLLTRLRTRMLVVGDRWRFGRGRAGDGALAQRILNAANCGFEAAPLLERDGEKVSSSRIRALIGRHAFSEAEALLGSAYRLSGLVKPGEGRGHRLGFPTANLEVPHRKLLPGSGVYAAVARHDGRDWAAAVSVGDKPTFGGTQMLIEAHLLGFAASIYGEQLSLRDWRFLRQQQRYDSAADLRAQIERDVAQTRALLSDLG